MVQVGAGGFILGIGFNEIMMLATAITLLVAIIPPFTNSNGLNVLDFPGSFMNSFNGLWFDNFRFFSDEKNITTCKNSVMFFGSLGYAPPVVPENLKTNSTANASSAIQTNSLALSFNILFKDVHIKELDAVTNVITTITSAIVQSTYGIVVLIIDILKLFSGLLIDCGIGGFRLVIGLSIAFYWSWHAITFLGSITDIMKFFTG